MYHILAFLGRLGYNHHMFLDVDPLILALSGVIAVLAIIAIWLVLHSMQMTKKFDDILEKGNIKDFKDIFLKQKDKHAELEKQLKEAFLRVEHLEDVSRKTIQKTGIVKFNPFNETGGNQSFVLALLDNQNNGFVISSLFVKEGNRMYAKPIKDAKSEILLSKEEMSAIEKAIASFK